jgi:hypothetical protein
MYGVSAEVSVKEIEENRRILIEWGDEHESTTVEFRLIPWDDDTYAQVTETGFTGDGDEIVAHVADSTGGFTNVLCALKAFLEHDVELNVVLDHTPPGDTDPRRARNVDDGRHDDRAGTGRPGEAVLAGLEGQRRGCGH